VSEYQIGKSLAFFFSCLTDSVEGNDEETSGTEIDHCINDNFVNMKSNSSTYFPETARKTNESIASYMLISPKVTNFPFKEENYI
jgi:hypothetical protein